MQIRAEFITALQDYLFLLEKNYPQKATLKLVSDKYRLNTQERSLLFRGVVVKKERNIRAGKTIKKLPDSGLVNIDGFNVLRTVASYMLGRPVFMAMDNFLRDASEMHGKPLKTKYRLQAFKLVIKVLQEKDLSSRFWFDAPVSFSGETVNEINEYFKSHNIEGRAETVRSADNVLKQITEGVIATADSAIIENAKVPVIDLSKLTLEHHFNPKFLNLMDFINFHD